MTQHGPTPRTQMIIAFYKAGNSLLETGKNFGVSKQAVHYAVQRHAPDSMRPWGLRNGRKPESQTFKGVGQGDARIYNVGMCRECKIQLFSYTPKARDLCGFCEAAKAA